MRIVACSVSVSFVPDDIVADVRRMRSECGEALSYESSSDVLVVAHALSDVSASVASRLAFLIRFSI